MLTLIRLLTFFLLPGYVTLRAIQRWERVPERDGFLDTVLLSILTSVLITSWWGLILTELGRFSLSNLWVPLVLYSLLMAILAGKRLWQAPTVRFTKGSALLAGILLAAVVLFFRPAETILGNHDAGLHMGGGIHLAQTGSFLVQDPLLPTIDSDRGSPVYYGGLEVKFPGLLLWDVAQGLAVPQFTSLYEVWIATSYATFGPELRVHNLLPTRLMSPFPHLKDLRLFLFITPAFGLLSVVVLYLLGKRLWDERVGLLAALLLTVNLAQVWYSRVSMSEVFTQFLILGGFYAFVSHVRTSRSGLAMLAGIALGEAVISRVDSILLLGPAFVLFIHFGVVGRQLRRYLLFFVPLLLLSAHGALHYAFFSAKYVAGIIVPLWTHYSPLLPYALAMILVFVFVAALFSRTNWRAWLPHWTQDPRTLRWAVGAAIILAAAYAYFLRPVLQPETLAYHALWRRDLPTGQGANLVELGWYISPLGIVLAIGGLLCALWERQDEGKALLLSTAALYSLVLIHNAYITPHHLFWVRRFLPVVIPAAMLLTGRALSELTRIRPKWLGVALAVGGLGFLVFSYLGTVRPIFWHIEDRNALDQVADLSREFDDRSVLLFEDSAAWGWLAFPLSCIHDTTSFVLQQDDLKDEQVFQAVGKWLDWGWRVYYVAHQGLITLDHGRFAFLPVGEWTIRCPQLEISFDRLPRTVEDRALDVQVYSVTSWTSSAISYPFVVDVGDFDYGFLNTGFYLREGGDPLDFRWTSSVAELYLPWQPRGDTVTLSLHLAGGRSADMEPAYVRLYVGDIQVDEFLLENEFEIRTVSVPSTIAPPNTPSVALRLEVNGWIPAEHGGQDVRELGVALDWLKLEDAAP